METYIIVNLNDTKDPVLGVYDSDWLAQKRLVYFKNVYENNELTIIKKYMEYSDRE